MSRGTCSDCGEAVVWARTIPGQQMMPLDPRPYPDDDTRANVARMPSASGDYCRVISRAEPFAPPAERRMMPHAATCTARRPVAVPVTEPEENDDDRDEYWR